MIDNFPQNLKFRLATLDDISLEYLCSTHPFFVYECPVAAFQILDLSLFPIVFDLKMATRHESVA
jgi:hypothetical protein